MARFFVVKPTQPGSNPRFNVGVAYLPLIILSIVNSVYVVLTYPVTSPDKGGEVVLDLTSHQLF
jgi:hypothetical protein